MKNQMEKPDTFQIVWHGYHSELLMPTNNLTERLDYIKREKPPEQIELRLRLIKPVQGVLPESIIKSGKRYADAREMVSRLEIEYVEARDLCNSVRYSGSRLLEGETQLERHNMIEKLSLKAGIARLAFDKARRKSLTMMKRFDKAVLVDLELIETLHTQECSDCPWNGITIFTDHERKASS
jgi:hypothetical protein